MKWPNLPVDHILSFAFDDNVQVLRKKKIEEMC